jgi:hypothetical protein
MRQGVWLDRERIHGPLDGISRAVPPREEPRLTDESLATLREGIGRLAASGYPLNDRERRTAGELRVP